MSGASRESTKQEIIIDGVFQCIRRLDKMTWHSYDCVNKHGDGMIDDAEYIISRLQQYINEIRYQMSQKDKD